MKKIIYIIILFFFNHIVTAQNDSCSLNINLSSELADYGIYTYPNINIDYHKHSFGIGPKFIISHMFNWNFLPISDDFVYPHSYNYFSLSLHYNYRFREKRTTPFFQYNIQYEKYSLTDFSSNDLNCIIDYKYTGMYLKQNFGLGYYFILNNLLYINTSLNFGLGINLKSIHSTENMKYTSKNKNGFTGILQLGIGYKL